MLFIKIFVLALLGIDVYGNTYNKFHHRPKRQISGAIMRGLKNSFSNLMERIGITDRNSSPEVREPPVLMSPPSRIFSSQNNRIRNHRNPSHSKSKLSTFTKSNFKVIHLQKVPVTTRSTIQTSRFRPSDTRKNNLFRDEIRPQREATKLFIGSPMMNDNLASSDDWKVKPYLQTSPVDINNILKEAKTLDIRDAHNFRITVFDHPDNLVPLVKPAANDVAKDYRKENAISFEPFVKVHEINHYINDKYQESTDKNHDYGDQLHDYDDDEIYYHSNDQLHDIFEDPYESQHDADEMKPVLLRDIRNSQKESYSENKIQDESLYKSEVDSKVKNTGYEFGYGIRDKYSGNRFYHMERKKNNRVEGSYKIQLPDGRVQSVIYMADETGFHPHITYEGKAKFQTH